MAIILGLVNAIVRPILAFLSCPLIVLTLGLFVLVINGLTLWIAAGIAVRWFHVGFYVDGFLAGVSRRADCEHRFRDSHGDS